MGDMTLAKVAETTRRTRCRVRRCVLKAAVAGAFAIPADGF